MRDNRMLICKSTASIDVVSEFEHTSHPGSEAAMPHCAGSVRASVMAINVGRAWPAQDLCLSELDEILVSGWHASEHGALLLTRTTSAMSWTS